MVLTGFRCVRKPVLETTSQTCPRYHREVRTENARRQLERMRVRNPTLRDDVREGRVGSQTSTTKAIIG